MKKCTGCEIYLDLKEFSKRSDSKDGLQNRCKKCARKNYNKWRRTKKGIINQIFRNQKVSCKQRGHDFPEYSFDDFYIYCMNSIEFNRIYDLWVNSGYVKNKVPSADRLDDSKTYSFSNIQFMSWEENFNKFQKQIRDGDKIHRAKPHKKVTMMDMDFNEIKVFQSMSQASREIGVHPTKIGLVCKGKRNHTGGYRWKYTEK